MTDTLSKAEAAELFHVAFLDVLGTRLEPSRYVLKGGTNLRYFFGSVRYSEDIDIDLHGKPPMNIEQKVDGILNSPAIGALLRIKGLSIAEHSKPKQTETTRRWKVGVETPGHADLVRTKIEFSGRNGDDRYLLEQIPRQIVAPFALRPPSVQHYVEDAPTEQKVEALADRPETQARDVFDLDLLLRQRPLPPGSIEPDTLTRAAELALQLPFAAYRDQVLPFLEPDVVEVYGSEESWEGMQTFVAESLEAAR
jgi:hypothetical protein